MRWESGYSVRIMNGRAGAEHPSFGGYAHAVHAATRHSVCRAVVFEESVSDVWSPKKPDACPECRRIMTESAGR
jgi:hypothetical protein